MVESRPPEWVRQQTPMAKESYATSLPDFSYHVSGGNHVLYDLLGGLYQHELVLSDPVILSWTGDYGVTDLGCDSISSFFSQHDYNQHYYPNWTRPANPRLHFNPVLGTTMLRRTVPLAGLAIPDYRNW